MEDLDISFSNLEVSNTRVSYLSNISEKADASSGYSNTRGGGEVVTGDDLVEEDNRQQKRGYKMINTTLLQGNCSLADVIHILLFHQR